MSRQLLKSEYFEEYGELAEPIVNELNTLLQEHDKLSKNELNSILATFHAGKEDKDILRHDLITDLRLNPMLYLSDELQNQIIEFKKNKK